MSRESTEPPKLRTLDLGQDADEDDIPRSPKFKDRDQRRQDKSGSLTRATLEHIDLAIRNRIGSGLADETKTVIADELNAQFDRLLKRIPDGAAANNKDRSPQGRSILAWCTVSVLALTLFVGSMVVTWEKINSVETRQNADEEYAMIVANWLVIEASTNYQRAANLDSMLRLIASQVGADVSSIPAPSETHPPTAIQRRNSNFLFKDEE